jgi:hypothetical protein
MAFIFLLPRYLQKGDIHGETLGNNQHQDL